MLHMQCPRGLWHELAFVRSNTEVVGFNPTRGMDVCARLLSVIGCAPAVSRVHNTAAWTSRPVKYAGVSLNEHMWRICELPAAILFFLSARQSLITLWFQQVNTGPIKLPGDINS
jgi:hypothetical protein